MAIVHLYFAAEDVNLSAQQRSTLWDEIRNQFGEEDLQPFPHRRMQRRLSLDASKVIFEAAVNDNKLTVNAFKNRLATLFGVAVGSISHNVNNVVFDTISTPVVTFAHGGQNKLRFAVFGGAAAQWNASRLETLAYIAANREEWDEPIEE